MTHTKKLTLSAFFLTLGLLMPFLTMQIPEIGSMLLPMHIPVIICGFVCGWKYGLAVGFFVPLIRNLIWGMPMLMTAIAMAFELAAYGAIVGLLYQLLKGNKLAIYFSLITAMIGGRILWGIVSFLLYQLMGTPFTWTIFIAGAFLQAIPGIILQLVAIPPIVSLLHKTGLAE